MTVKWYVLCLLSLIEQALSSIHLPSLSLIMSSPAMHFFSHYWEHLDIWFHILIKVSVPLFRHPFSSSSSILSLPTHFLKGTNERDLFRNSEDHCLRKKKVRKNGWLRLLCILSYKIAFASAGENMNRILHLFVSLWSEKFLAHVFACFCFQFLSFPESSEKK